ncbi:Fungal Zn binuclear cluster domain containing protein [Macrophomina phaseolina MS6]|uniref:Fungal Zn binuclear cluster domain containing protein n=1 Tax=Macrophomina phaseolina (strain MS6) TaxID=1126212 RepID=K2R5I2_MACPH|nr:Fungal Zn binuclear cluster domain containing protein [Macrophomina phaseolina MS6]
MHPMYPLADQKYTFARHRALLIAQEPFLCTTILAITSRYTWFQTGNFSSKATEVHTATYKYVQAEFQRFLWGSGRGRCTEIATLGLIESIMLMVEWHPRSMDLNTPAGDISGSYGLAQYGYDDVPRTSDRSFEAEMRQAWNTFKPVNTTSWWLLCIAINLADGIGLHQVITTGIDHLRNENHTRRARVHEFLVSLVWERSFRLSRKCMLNHPSDTPKQIFVCSDAEPLDEILESRAELYRLIRLVENTIYPNPRHTADIIATGDYHSTVNDFCSLLNGWKTRFDRVKGVSPPLAKHIEIMWHNTRAFLYSIALQAFVTRTNSTLGGPLTEDNGSVPAPRSSNVTQAGQDEIMIGEWIQASECIISVALELHRDGLLRYAPLNVLYHAISGSLALLKVKRLPLQPKNDPMGLLIQLAHALEESSVDDAHFGHRYAVCLKGMIRKMEQGRYQCVVPSHEPTGETSSMTDGMRAMGAGGEASHPTEHGSAGGLGLDVAFGAFGESFQDQLSFLECHDDWTRWLSF